MKTKLFLLTFLLTSFAYSQIIWTGGGGNADWNEPSNWSTNSTPTVNDDVEIPSGFTVTINGSATCQSLELQGSTILNIDTFGSFSSTQPSIFEPGTTVNWARGTINCSLLVSQGTMNLTSSADKLFETSTIVNNNGSINIIGSGDLFLRDGTVLNNQIDGTIDMRADDGDIDDLGGIPILNNAGIIRRSTSAGLAQIKAIELNNNGGTIQVDSGTLRIIGIGDKNLTGGTYVVSAGTVLNLDSTINVSGFLLGTIEGDLNWNNIVSVPVSATFNFTGSGNFNWTGGVLTGGGVLTNESTINLTGTLSKSIQATTLNNSGTLNITGTGDLFIQNGGIVNNQMSAVIDMQTDGGNILSSGTTPNILNNSGVLRRTTSSGLAQISVQLNNSATINVETGELEITGVAPFTNEVSGVIKGTGVIDLPLVANYTNDGVFAPGASPGTLTVDGDFESTVNSILEIELDGLTQGTEYDLLAILGNAEFEGSLMVSLNFDADLNDEFVIATTTGTINSCNLPSTVSASFGGFTYDFSVTCRNNNELVLSVTNETLSSDEFELSDFNIYPNPTRGSISIEGVELSSVTLYNITGQKIFKTVRSNFSIKDLEDGIYFIQILDTQGRLSTKKIIKRF